MIETLGIAAPRLAPFVAAEDAHGVRPLVETFFDGVGIGDRGRGTLGLFTPTPEMTLESAALSGETTGERSGSDLLLRGEVRVPNPDADGAIVLVRLESEHRLAWVEPVSRDGRLRLDGTLPTPARHVSRPVALPELLRRLEGYAGVWAVSAVGVAVDEVRALRRAARVTRHEGRAFSTSQWVSLEISKIEIEAGLAELLCRDGDGGLAAAASAARVLHAVAEKRAELRDQAGLEIEGHFLETARSITAFLGGPLRIESDLARSLGIEVSA